VPTLDDAIALAIRVHQNQTDRGGAPYILHPLRVMLRMVSDVEKTVAILHDVVEKGPVTLDGLRAAGYDVEVVRAIDALTRREGETYQELVERAEADALACKVKIADLEDHLDLRWSRELEVRDVERLNRYRAAWLYLTKRCV
jgi:(p)ppGpp synthase/HD superfamily hydrolase